MPGRRFSLIVPVFNQMRFTSQFLDSVEQQTDHESTEIVIIDNGSDPPMERFLEAWCEERDRYKLIRNPANMGFPHAINQGLEIAEGNLLVWSNNDTILTAECLERMEHCLRTSSRLVQSSRIGLVGPASNYAPGAQYVPSPNYSTVGLDQFATDFAEANQYNWILTNVLSGFMLMMYRRVYEDVGPLNEDFFPGGWEDNEYCHRAALKGWKSIVAGDTYVHHHGSKTLKAQGMMATCDPQFFPYVEKWAQPREQKLIAIYRVKDVQNYVQSCIRPMCELVDEALFWVSPSGDNTADALRNLPNAYVREWHEDLSERQIRNNLIAWAEDREADWIISFDADERFEAKVDRAYLDRLMNPRIPNIYRYGFPVYTFWDDNIHVRQDGIFGQMVGPRLFRSLPYQHIFDGAPTGLHAGHSPAFGVGAQRLSSARILHYGYASYEERERKYGFYQQNDQIRDTRYIGATDYRHLVQQAVTVFRYQSINGITLCMLAYDDEARVRTILDGLYGFYDQAVVLIDSRSTDRTLDVCKHFGVDYYVHEWPGDFSVARNLLISYAKHPWILALDPDETLQDVFLPAVRRMTEGDVDFYYFKMMNLKPGEPTAPTERISLFRNMPWVRYSGKVHEGFEDCFRERANAGLPVKSHSTGIPIQHMGYMKSPKEIEAKLLEYIRLDVEQMKERPFDPKPPFNLALHLRDDGELDEAVRLLEKSAKIDPSFFPPRQELSLLHLHEAKRWVEEGLKALPPNHDLRSDAQSVHGKICELLGVQQDIDIEE